MNKAPDGSIDDVDQGTIQALYTLRDNGEITQEQLVNAAPTATARRRAVSSTCSVV